MPDMKPCPLCGRTDSLERFTVSNEHRAWSYGQTVSYEGSGGCLDCNLELHAEAKTAEEAGRLFLERWNRRKAETG